MSRRLPTPANTRAASKVTTPKNRTPVESATSSNVGLASLDRLSTTSQGQRTNGLGIPPVVNAINNTATTSVPSSADPRSSAVDLHSSNTSESVSAAFAMPASSQTTHEDLYKAYLASQAEVGRLQAENARLTAALSGADLRFAGAASKLRSNAIRLASSQLGVTDPAILDRLTVLKMIKKLGAHFQLFYGIIINPAALSITIRPDFHPYDLERYDSPQNHALGTTSELYECLPPAYCDLILNRESSTFSMDYAKAFRQGASAARSTALSDLRDAAPHYAMESRTDKKHSDVEPEIHTLLDLIGYNAETNEYDIYPPLIYSNNDTSNIKGRFQSQYLFRIARAVIFGAGASFDKNRAVGRSVSQFLRTDVVAQTTFGLIAWTATMGRYLLSKDNRFTDSGTGAESGIEYLKNYDTYKEWLTRAYHGTPAQSAWVVKLLARWDNEVFATHNKNKGKSDADEDVSASDPTTSITAALANDLDQLGLESSDADDNDTEPQQTVPEDAHNPDDDFDDMYMDESESERLRQRRNSSHHQSDIDDIGDSDGSESEPPLSVPSIIPPQNPAPVTGFTRTLPVFMRSSNPLPPPQADITTEIGNDSADNVEIPTAPTLRKSSRQISAAAAPVNPPPAKGKKATGSAKGAQSKKSKKSAA